jgi:acetate kinase
MAEKSFNKSVLLDEKVLEEFEECNDLAPLHNPANLKGVMAAVKATVCPTYLR